MNTISIGSKSGGVCILNTRACLRDLMQQAADAVGCGKYIPKQPPATTVLRLAMHGVGVGLYGKQRKQPISVRHVDGNDFECVRVIPDWDRNKYLHLFTATIDKQWRVTVTVTNPAFAIGAQVEPALAAAVGQLRDYLPATIVSKATVRIFQSWKGVPMAEGGGVWFLGEQHLDKYQQFASGVRGANGSGPLFSLTKFDIDANPETAGEVLNKVRETVAAGVAEIMDDIANSPDGFNDRSIKVRVARSNSMLDMIRQYRDLMGVDMPELVEAIEQVKSAVSIHRLLSASV